MTNKYVTNPTVRRTLAYCLLSIREDIQRCNRAGYTESAKTYKDWIPGVRTMAQWCSWSANDPDIVFFNERRVSDAYRAMAEA